ncbi:hypothetical protein PCANB_002568, partial [Pneumocystis canis]
MKNHAFIIFFISIFRLLWCSEIFNKNLNLDLLNNRETIEYSYIFPRSVSKDSESTEDYLLALILGSHISDESKCILELTSYCNDLKEIDPNLENVELELKNICESVEKKCKNLETKIKAKCDKFEMEIEK